ncbi:hypothetical protein D3C87_1819870 [compost metagenome]
MRNRRPARDSFSTASARQTQPSSHIDTGSGSFRWALPHLTPAQTSFSCIRISPFFGATSVRLLKMAMSRRCSSTRLRMAVLIPIDTSTVTFG